jgi:hypothetical protein
MHSLVRIEAFEEPARSGRESFGSRYSAAAASMAGMMDT